MWKPSLTLAGLLAFGANCGGGGSNNSGPDAATPDATPIDAAFAIAPHGAQPQAVTLGGPVLTAPLVVPIFFTGDDAMQAQVEGFLAALPGSAYWHATTSEYGIGDITIAPSIVSSDTPPTTDAALQTFITTNSDGAHGWPANTPNTIYTVFLPDGVILSSNFGTSCNAFGGYHAETQEGSIIYALLPRCTSGVLSGLTPALSHELIEASSDPLFSSNPAYQTTDAMHAIWGIAPGGELGDMCEYVHSAFQILVDNYLVQRTWSNAAAAAQHDPCVPELAATPYLGAEPVLTEQLPFQDVEGNNITTPGVTITSGSSATIEVDLFSDTPTADWTVQAIDADNQLYGSQPELAFTWDHTTGNNGSKLQLTIQRTANGGGGGSILLIESTVDNHSVSEWWGYVAQ